MAKQGIILSERRNDELNRALDLVRRYLPLPPTGNGSNRLGDDPKLWFPCRPDSNFGDAPAYGVIQITGCVLDDSKGVFYLTFQQPDSDSLSNCALLDHAGVPNIGADGQFGRGRCTFEPWWALYNNANTPAYDEEWGTEANTWKLKQGNTGFRVFGATDTTNGRILVERKFASSASSSRWIEFALSESMAAADASATASVDNYWGGDNPGASVTVWNKSASTNYIFSGTTGAKGLATYDDRASKWRIVQMECG